MSTPEPETDRSLWQRRIQRDVPTMTPKEHLERLRYDIDTVLHLQLRSFSDESWLPAADALAEYGFGVIRAWMHTGQIYSEVARSGYGALPPCPSAWLDDDTVQGNAEPTAQAPVLPTVRAAPRQSITLPALFRCFRARWRCCGAWCWRPSWPAGSGRPGWVIRARRCR